MKRFNSKITAAALQAQVDALKQKAEAPVTNLVINFDGRTGEVSAIGFGDQVPISLLCWMLDAARDRLIEAEVKQRLEQAAPNEET